jgi:membrane protein YqaA with SNARE-associated domain
VERKAFVNIAAAVTAAAVSAVILYEMLIAGSLLQEAGLAGVFLASMFSHLTIVGRDMFVPTFLALAPRYHPLLLGLAAGLGGAIGEVSTYYWGLGIKDALKGAEKDDTLPKWVEKYGLLAVLIVSATPLPDTPIVLLAGSARLPLRKLLVVEASGKTLW